MSLFKKAVPPEPLDDTAKKLSATIDSLVPIFVDAIAQNGTDFIKDFKRRDIMLESHLQPVTDELALKTYGLNRKEMALVTLKAYLVFVTQAYLSVQHIFKRENRQTLIDKMILLLIDDRSKSFFQSEWAKLVHTLGDNTRKEELLVGDLLASLGLVDSSFFAQDLNAIWSRHVPLIETLSGILILRIDRMLNPKNYPAQRKLVEDHLSALSSFKIDRDNIQRIWGTII